MFNVREVHTGVLVDETPLMSAVNTRKLLASLKTTTDISHRDGIDILGPSNAKEKLAKLKQSPRTSVLHRLAKSLRSWRMMPEERDNSQFFREADILYCRGALAHCDSGWRESLFWTYTLQAEGVDLVFPNLGLRIPLKPHQLIVFDPGQPHMVTASGQATVQKELLERLPPQVFLAGDIKLQEEDWHRLGVKYGGKLPRNPCTGSSQWATDSGELSVAAYYS